QGLPQIHLLETFGGEHRVVRVTNRRWKRPMGRLQVRVIDEATGAATPARIYETTSDGKFYAPSDAYARIAYPRMLYRSGEHCFLSEGEFTVDVPPGKFAWGAVKGFEYWPAVQQVDVKEGAVSRATLVLKRMIDMPARGWINGSTHSHLNKGGNAHNTLSV